MLKKTILIIFALIICIVAAYYAIGFINSHFGAGDASRYLTPLSFDTSAYSYKSEQAEIKLAVLEDDTLSGWVKSDSATTNISVKFEHVGTAYEYTSAKIYNTDTGEYVDYVTVLCDGQELKLTKKHEDKYDPGILENIKNEDSIFLYFSTEVIVLQAEK